MVYCIASSHNSFPFLSLFNFSLGCTYEPMYRNSRRTQERIDLAAIRRRQDSDGIFRRLCKDLGSQELQMLSDVTAQKSVLRCAFKQVLLPLSTERVAAAFR